MDAGSRTQGAPGCGPAPHSAVDDLGVLLKGPPPPDVSSGFGLDFRFIFVHSERSSLPRKAARQIRIAARVLLVPKNVYLKPAAVVILIPPRRTLRLVLAAAAAEG
jgi:hypothetical protein